MSNIPEKELKAGDILMHTKTGNRYVYEGPCKAKFQDEWISAISYISALNGERFVTSPVRLENSFIVVEFRS